VQKMATLAELSAEKTKIQAAIDKILVAQEYSEGGTSVKKAQLETLYRRLDSINTRIDRQTGGVSTSVIFGGK
jgi:hypothetical protein